MNKELIERLIKEIEWLKQWEDKIDSDKEDIYKVRERLEKQLKIYQKLTERNIEIYRKYYLTEKVWFQLVHNAGFVKGYFNFSKGYDIQWIKDTYIDNEDGIFHWLNDTINDEFMLFSNSSKYSEQHYISLKDALDFIQDKDGKSNVEKIIEFIENIIQFVIGEGNYENEHDYVVSVLEHKLERLYYYAYKASGE